MRGTWLFHYLPFFLLCKFGTRQGMEEGSRGIQQYNLDEGMEISFMICESDLIFKQNTAIKFVFIKLYKTISVIRTLDILLKLRSYLLILVYTNAQLWLIGLLTYFSYSWWAFPNSSTHFARDAVFIYLINWPIVIFLVSHITGFVQILLNNRIIECWINNRLIPQTNFCI